MKEQEKMSSSPNKGTRDKRVDSYHDLMMSDETLTWVIILFERFALYVVAENRSLDPFLAFSFS